MKKGLLTIGLCLAISAVALCQDNKPPAAQPAPKTYYLPFNKPNLDDLVAKCETAVNTLATSQMPSKEANGVIALLYQIENTFKETYRVESATDSAKTDKKQVKKAKDK